MSKLIKILFITWSVPFPTNVGGRQRTNLLYRALSELGVVDLISLHNPSRYSADELYTMRSKFRLSGIAPLTRPIDRENWRWLKLLAPRWGNRIAHNVDPAWSYFGHDSLLIDSLKNSLNYQDYDLIVGRYARSLAKLGLPMAGSPPVVLDIDDLDTDIYESRLRSGAPNIFNRFILRRHIAKVRVAQDSYLKKIQHFWIANQENLSDPILRNGALLPNIPFDDEIADPVPVQVGGLDIMTIGSYGHRPNVIGVDWFLYKVWPLVYNLVPGCTFRIYGSQLSASLRERWSKIPGVNVIGYVENVSSAYNNAALAVCPVQSGAGTNIKVLEAGKYGRQCILTEAASRGFICDEHLRGILKICNCANEMATKISEILSDPESNQRDADRFRLVISKYYSFNRFSSVVKRVVEQALAADRV